MIIINFMKKISLITAMAVTCIFDIQAETYTESFESIPVVFGKSDAPDSWDRIADVPNIYGDELFITYRRSSGGKSGYYLSAPRQQVYFEDYDETVATNDLLVTPEVSGTVSFYLKNPLNLSYAACKVYECVGNGSGYTVGTVPVKSIKNTDMSNSEWREFTIDLSEPTRLAFWLSSVGIDELSAIPKENDVREMTIEKIELSNARPYPDAENITTISYNVTIRNTGTTDLVPGDGGYSLSIVSYNNEGLVYGTTPVAVTIAPESTVTVVISADINPGETVLRDRFDVVENLNGTKVNGQWLDVRPYMPELALFYSGETKEIAAPINFGTARDASVTKQLVIKNNGGAPMTISALQLPDGYSSSLDMPVTLDPDATVSAEITLGVETGGVKVGDAIFVLQDGTTKSYRLTGAVETSELWSLDFETGIPGTIMAEGWTASETPEGYAAEYGEKIGDVGYEHGRIISPLLEVGDGESLVFSAAKKAYHSYLQVYYSSDKNEWIPACKIGVRNEDSGDGADEFFSDTKANDKKFGEDYDFTQYAISDIPAGKWYVAFDGWYARLDNIMGYKEAHAEHDVAIAGMDYHKQAEVGCEYTASITLKNANTVDEPAGEYSVRLVVGGEEVATAEAPLFISGTEQTFIMKYTPSASGKAVAYMEFSAGEYSLRSLEWTISIEDMNIYATSVVGTPDAQPNGTSTHVPLLTSATYSRSETIYKASELKIPTGSQIMKITYDGFVATDKEISATVSMWAECTDDEEVDPENPASLSSIELVYRGEWSPQQDGYISDLVKVLSIPFENTDRFIYDGKNLRVVLESDSEDYKSVNFAAWNNGTSMYIAVDELINKDWTIEEARPVITVYFVEPAGVAGVAHTGDGIVFDMENSILSLPVNAKSFELYNISGIKVSSGINYGSISLGNAMAGMYIIKVLYQDGSIHTDRIVKR